MSNGKHQIKVLELGCLSQTALNDVEWLPGQTQFSLTWCHSSSFLSSSVPLSSLGEHSLDVNSIFKLQNWLTIFAIAQYFPWIRVIILTSATIMVHFPFKYSTWPCPSCSQFSLKRIQNWNQLRLLRREGDFPLGSFYAFSKLNLILSN